MNDTMNYLLTFICGQELLKVAAQFKRDDLPEDVFKYYREPENQTLIKTKLPSYLGDLGHLVEIEDIYEIVGV